ncbi:MULTISPECIES: hypothetical protein [unclassified Rhizobium]|uniref:hypothetical protein n=1 Tax=unclassified Rhizobium TaxID=2613769 RepID=UPI00117B8CD1|nr:MULTISPECIES: hypothetical protein [unclassified Rhizobium]MDQ4408829.1 hypothetical protein [Rhizobium sp. AN63]
MDKITKIFQIVENFVDSGRHRHMLRGLRCRAVGSVCGGVGAASLDIQWGAMNMGNPAIVVSAIAGLAFAFMISGSPALASDAPKHGLNIGTEATGVPIKIGSAVSASGPDDVSDGARAAHRYFQCAGKNGGVNGQSISFSIVDDDWKPEQSARARVWSFAAFCFSGDPVSLRQNPEIRTAHISEDESE